jgi:ribosome-associated protein
MQTIEFSLRGEYVELNDLLKLTGVAESGGRAKVMVGEGLVKVDGAVESRKTAKIRSGQTVECGDVHILVSAPPAKA